KRHGPSGSPPGRPIATGSSPGPGSSTPCGPMTRPRWIPEKKSNRWQIPGRDGALNVRPERVRCPVKDASPEMISIFHGALERLRRKGRAAYRDAAAGPDATVRERIEAWLRAHKQAGGFLPESETFAPRATAGESCATERPGVVLAGRYKLLEQIGEGGMG